MDRAVLVVSLAVAVVIVIAVLLLLALGLIELIGSRPPAQPKVAGHA